MVIKPNLSLKKLYNEVWRNFKNETVSWIGVLAMQVVNLKTSICIICCNQFYMIKKILSSNLMILRQCVVFYFCYMNKSFSWWLRIIITVKRQTKIVSKYHLVWIFVNVYGIDVK